MKDEKETNDRLEVIHSYSRGQALEDGFLVDVTETAKQAGLRYPVALSHDVYESYVVVPPDVKGQDQSGRLWDILWMLACAIRQGKDVNEIRYELFVRNDNRKPQRVRLKAVCGPDDDGEPCITVMHPNKD